MTNLQARFAKIRLLVLDSDGVLTDGGVYIDQDGHEFRRFNIKDGLGLKLVKKQGIHLAIISGSPVAAVAHRAQNLGIEDIYTGIDDKLSTLNSLCSRLQLSLDQVAYIGDDLPDLPVLQAVGLACCPADAVNAVKDVVHYVSPLGGGQGIVRDVCDLLLKEHSA